MPKTLTEIQFLININEWDLLTDEDCRYLLKALKRMGPETKKVAEKIEKEAEEDGSETYFRVKKDREKVPSCVHTQREKSYGWGFRAI